MVDKGEVIKCPICRAVHGNIEIRCLRCKNISKIELKKS